MSVAKYAMHMNAGLVSSCETPGCEFFSKIIGEKCPRKSCYGKLLHLSPCTSRLFDLWKRMIEFHHQCALIVDLICGWSCW